jgi:hypothetical protein
MIQLERFDVVGRRVDAVRDDRDVVDTRHRVTDTASRELGNRKYARRTPETRTRQESVFGVEWPDRVRSVTGDEVWD